MTNILEVLEPGLALIEEFGLYGIRLITRGAITTRWKGKSEEEGREAWAALLAQPRCLECGLPEDGNYCEPSKTELREKQLCFNCNFWTHLLKDNPAEVVVVGTNRYTIGPVLPEGYRGFKGFDGAKVEIKFFGGREVTTCNLWHNGEVPVHFRDRIKPNAEFTRWS
jgi:hypothetical protein